MEYKGKEYNRRQLGRRINQVRKQKHITAEVLAERCGINASFMRQIECGAGSPSMQTFVAVCNVLSVSPEYLLQDSLEYDTASEVNSLTTGLKGLAPQDVKRLGLLYEALFGTEKKDGTE